MSTNKEEDKYFQQLAQERREAQRRADALKVLMEQEREGIAAALATSEDISREALELGFSAHTAAVMPLVPLIQVAWADGSVSSSEERVILEAAQQGGIKPGTRRFRFLYSLLVKRPPARFFERTNIVISPHARRRFHAA